MKTKFEKLIIKKLSQVIEARGVLNEVYQEPDMSLFDKGVLEMQILTIEEVIFDNLMETAKIIYDLDEDDAFKKILEFEEKLYEQLELEAVKEQEKEEKGEKDND